MTNQTEQGANPERAAFEAWAKADNYSVERRGDNYAYTDTRDLWKGWQARAAVPTSEGYTSDGWTDVAQGLPEPQKPVLLDIGGKYPIRAMWVAAKTLPVGGGDDDDFGEYVEDDDEWYCPEGWYEWNQYENRHWSVGATPLRWMPLPATPGDCYAQ